jgi:hypothetical protein
VLVRGLASPALSRRNLAGAAAGLDYGGAPVSAGWTYFPQVFLSGTAIVLDPAGPLYAAIGAGNLAPWADGTSSVGHAALSN